MIAPERLKLIVFRFLKVGNCSFNSNYSIIETCLEALNLYMERIITVVGNPFLTFLNARSDLALFLRKEHVIDIFIVGCNGEGRGSGMSIGALCYDR